MKPQNFFAFKHLISAGLVFFSLACAHAQEIRVGHVSSERIMRESALAKLAESKIEREFSGRDKELSKLAERLKAMAAKLDKEMPVLAESERLKRQREFAELDREFQQKQHAFRQDLNQRRNEEISAVITKAQGVIKKIAEAEKFDIILQDAVYVSPRVDITEKVLKALNK